MLPGSHLAPINAPSADLTHNRLLLADAFSEFVTASSQLESSYRDLQQEVAQLGRELVERNAALSRSVAENEQMRAALQQILDSMPCGVVVLDDDEKIVTVNPEARRLLDLGTQVVNSLRELSRICHINFELLRAESGGTLDNEVCISTSEGKRWLAIGSRTLSLVARPKDTGTGRAALQTIWILLDISANKQAERERESARNAMALAEVSTILAHEIRNPLASMELFAGLILDDREHSSQWVSHLRAGIRLLSGTVNNVLSVHGGGSPDLVPLDLLSCVRSAVEFAEPIAAEAGVSLSFSSNEDELVVMGSESGLQQIVLNLICNAIRHTPDAGRITISVGRNVVEEKNLAMVEVQDTGSGIPAHVIDHIFAAGFSGSGDRPGLGLAVCKRIMNQHGGEIRVSSRLNHGSTFELEFPIL